MRRCGPIRRPVLRIAAIGVVLLGHASEPLKGTTQEAIAYAKRTGPQDCVIEHGRGEFNGNKEP